MENIKYSNAYAEVLHYLKGIDKEYIDRIPKKLMNFFEQNVNFSALLFRVLTICISADSSPFFNCFKNKI